MIFRLASKLDIEALLDVRIRFLEDDSGVMEENQKQQLRATLAEYYNAHIGEDFFAFVAEVNGVFVSSAFLVVQERPASLIFPTGKIGLVVNVYTNPEYRRRGLAEKLMAMAIAEAKHHDLSYIELESTQSGEKLYVKLGFEYDSTNYIAMKYLL